MITLPIWAITLLSFVCIFLVALLTWAYLTAQRLHRLHQRCEQAAISLEGALDRRAVAARAVARDIRRYVDSGKLPPEDAVRLRNTADAISHCAHVAEAIDPAKGTNLEACEEPENELTLMLERCTFDVVNTEEVNDLHEAIVRLTLARRFYNNAVRDALEIHNRKPVKFFHLAGYAHPPQFFNIIEDIDLAREE